MEKTIKQTTKILTKDEIETNLKTAIQKFFNQLKFGCFRNKCFNTYCYKSERNIKIYFLIILVKKYDSDKSILYEAIKLAKESNYSLNICPDYKEIYLLPNKNSLENEINSFDNEDIDYIKYFDLDRLPPLNLNFSKLSGINDNVDFEKNIKNINIFFENIIKNFPKTEFDIKENLNSKVFIRWNFYFYYVTMKILVIISLDTNFNYSQFTNDSLNLFFKNIISIKSNFKQFLSLYKNGYLIPTNSMTNISPNEFEILKLQKKVSSNIAETNSQIAKMDVDEDSVKKPCDYNLNSENKENKNLEKKSDFSEEEKNYQNNFYFSNKISKNSENKNLLKNLKYNIDEKDSILLFTQNSNYSQLLNLSEGIFDPLSLFENYFELMPLVDFVSNKEKLLNIIHNYHNFLLLIIMMNVDEETEGFQLNEILFNFLPIFEIFYKLNEILKIVENNEFYNDYINKHVDLNFELEGNNYLKYLKNEEKSKFCWIRYFWIFDTRSKSDILFEFNCKTQRTEFLNHFHNMTQSLFSNQSFGHAYLIIEIKRNNIIEDSLNFLVNSQNNFKKQLKIRFIGEQGIDEGGVKKEYFMLLVRQLFNPEYGMFTYSEKTRFFWFNPTSFETKIKFELIGMIFGLAFFNNVILDVKFPLVIFKKILNITPTLHDLQEIDKELYNSFVYLLNTKETNLKEILGTTFTAVLEAYGEKQIIPLKVKNNFLKFFFIITYFNFK